MSPRRPSRVGSAIALALAPSLAHADSLAKAPLQYLRGFGSRAYPVVHLTWGTLIISIAVILIIAGLVLIGCLKRNPPPPPAASGKSPVGPERPGLDWIYVGTGVSTLVLIATAVWTMMTLAAVSRPPNEPAISIEVRGHQWWWEVLYGDKDPSKTFTTANDIHIPVGQPVRISLTGADVIHSFWVPALSGKMDTIPGQTNTVWIEADKPGTYRGQCTEYCGKQHAHMGFTVTADPPEAFQAWRDHQVGPAPDPADAAVLKGEEVFVTRCGACHAVRGTDAGGRFGPDLSHLMQRRSLAAGTLSNNPVQLSAWIADPQHIKPGALMPRLDISGPDLAAIRRFLQTLN